MTNDKRRRRADVINPFLAPDGSELGSVGERIAWARQRQRITQKSLAELTGKVRTTIAQYELGKINPPVSVIDALAETLKVSPEFIAFGESAPKGIDGRSPGRSLHCKRIVGGEEIEEGVLSVPPAVADDLRIGSGAVVLKLETGAPIHGIHQSDRLIVDTDADISPDGRLYVLHSTAGVEVVRSEPSLISSVAELNLTGGSGQSYRLNPLDIRLVGAVLGIIRRPNSEA